jgi:hypothetical protein
LKLGTIRFAARLLTVDVQGPVARGGVVVVHIGN